MAVAGLYFILLDTVFAGGYKSFYDAMTGGETPVAASEESSSGATIDPSLLPSIDAHELETAELQASNLEDLLEMK